MPGETKVVAPDGREWKVSRSWLPAQASVRTWKLALPRPNRNKSFHDRSTSSNEWLDHVWMFSDLPGCGPVMLVVGAVLIVLAIVLVLPVLVLVLGALVVIAAVALALRVLFRRPWTVEAESGSERREWAVVGWRASGNAIRHVADELRNGRRPEEISTAVFG